MQFNADLSNKFKSVKAVYIYASERSRYALSENDFVHYAVTYCFGDIEGLKSINFVKLVLSQHIFWYFDFQYFMNGGSDPYKTYPWKSVLRTFRHIYTSCFNKLRFLAENSKKLQKMNLFGQFKDHNMEARQMAPFFHLLFPL